MRSAYVQAQPNIALIKYWGKANIEKNLPAVPSLSVTLDSLWTRTRVSFDTSFAKDEFVLNGETDEKGGQRIFRFLDQLRSYAGTEDRVRVETENNFPTAAGLASSASGFAALVVAADAALNLELTAGQLSQWARLGSGSAARSIFGGFVQMPLDKQGEVSEAYPLLAKEDWPLEVVIAITHTGAKTVGSTEGMELTRMTSPFYEAWVQSSHDDLAQGLKAVLAKDFSALAQISEQSCLKMHGLAMSADPGLIYWNPVTVAALQEIRRLQQDGESVFFTMDAGPQVKAICTPESSETVVSRLEQVPGVQKVLRTGLGAGARVIL